MNENNGRQIFIIKLTLIRKKTTLKDVFKMLFREISNIYLHLMKWISGKKSAFCCFILFHHFFNIIKFRSNRSIAIWKYDHLKMKRCFKFSELGIFYTKNRSVTQEFQKNSVQKVYQKYVFYKSFVFLNL